MERQLAESGHAIQLIQRSELQAIRQEWLKDPNEPDWQDSLPALFREVYPNEDIEWIENDAGAFSESDAHILRQLEVKHKIPAEVVMKLIDVELAQVGLGKRKKILSSLDQILNFDWEDFEVINSRHHQRGGANVYADKLAQLQADYDAAG